MKVLRPGVAYIIGWTALTITNIPASAKITLVLDEHRPVYIIDESNAWQYIGKNELYHYYQPRFIKPPITPRKALLAALTFMLTHGLLNLLALLLSATAGYFAALSLSPQHTWPISAACVILAGLLMGHTRLKGTTPLSRRIVDDAIAWKNALSRMATMPTACCLAMMMIVLHITHVSLGFTLLALALTIILSLGCSLFALSGAYHRYHSFAISDMYADVFWGKIAQTDLQYAELIAD